MAADTRVLVVSHAGVVEVNQSVYRRLLDLGWEVTLVVPASWRHEYAPRPFVPKPLPGLERNFRRLHVLGAGKPARHVYLARVGRLLEEVEPAVVFLEEETFALPTFQWAYALARRGIPFGVQADENLDRRLPLPVRAGRSFVLRTASFVAARSPTAALLARAWGARGETPLIPHAVPLWKVDTTQARPGTFTVGYAGRLVAEKGVPDLVAAIGQLEPPIRLLLAGGGPLASSVVRNAGRGIQIDIRTNVSHGDMPKHYAEMDVLVLPSRTTPTWAEQFGRVLVEALSCGVPVIGSSSGEIPWVIEATGGGIVFPEGDVDALATTITALRVDPQRRAALAEAGREAAVRLFGESAVADVLSAALAQARRT